jgi:hypothetical protein
MPYRDFNDGSQDNQNFNLYDYELQLNGSKTVKSIELPQNRFVAVLGMTLTKHASALDWVNPCGFSPLDQLR